MSKEKRVKLDLSAYPWSLSGYSPTSWRMGRVMEQAIPCIPEIAEVDAVVPGSVHQALRDAGILPDWNTKLNSFKCEWVDHRDWIFKVEIPEAHLDSPHRVLRCLGLDGYGLVVFNGCEVGSFRNGYIPHAFDLSGIALRETNALEIVFSDLPRFNGTPNISSKIRDLKARFNYAWDWMPRNVQIGIWDELWIELDRESQLDEVFITTSYDVAKQAGCLALSCSLPNEATVTVSLAGAELGGFVAAEWQAGIRLSGLGVSPWQCNGQGDQPLYTLRLELTGPDGICLETREEQVAWLPCAGAPAGADPWICELNGEKVFLVGVNWTPIRAHYADVSEADYRKRLDAYREIGFNVLRVWGGAFLEKEIFYRLCDEMGFLVWQEFPLSSSGPDNEPPHDAATVEAWAEVARSYVRRRRHHVSLLIWCGGNELQTTPENTPGCGKPLTTDHPLLGRFAEICAEEDPLTRYLPCSSSGPVFVADEADFGKGIHWDVHGPWRVASDSYWQEDDALFRSEIGAPGASSMELINEYYPDCDLLPVSEKNAYWRRCFWWIDEAEFVETHGRKPESIDEYVAWSQAHQAQALVRGLKACIDRFPRMGGFIIWMGHDSFPCLANTSILDFHGEPKPAADALRSILNPGTHVGRLTSVHEPVMHDRDSSLSPLSVKSVPDFPIGSERPHACWQEIPWQTMSRVGEGPLAYQTRCKMARSESGLYFLVEAEDATLTCTLSKDEANLFTEDVVEIFLQPDPDIGLYVEYEISPLGYELMLLVSNDGTSFHGWRPWNQQPSQHTRKATRISGGEKKSGGAVTGWQAEVFLPFDLFRGLGCCPPQPGSAWRGNVYRIDYDGDGPTHWALFGETGTAFHDYWNFGRFHFQPDSRENPIPPLNPTSPEP